MKRIFKWLTATIVAALIAGFALGYTPDSDPAAMKAKYGSASSQFIALEPGLTVHARDEGNRAGRALIFVHGSNSSLQTWEPWVKRLGAKYRIVTLDLPGHGMTGPHPGGIYDYPVFVDVVDKIAAKLGLQHFVIGGNSMGGGVTWMYALAHPEKVDGLILVDAAGAPEWQARKIPIGFRLARMPVVKNLALYITPRSMFESSLKTSMYDQKLVTSALVDRYWELNRFPGNRAATLQRFSMQHNNHPASKEMLAPIKAPVLILWGEEDNLIPVASARWFAGALPGSKLVIYPKTGHLPMEEVPDASAVEVDAFVGNLDLARK